MSGTELGLISEEFHLPPETALIFEPFGSAIAQPERGTFYTSDMNLADYRKPAIPDHLGALD
ncbi:hypothetical protein BDW66DRAFT_143282, partial [Aspergillus desertorum]